MSERACQSPEEAALFASGAVSEKTWRRIVRHLSECPACRRHAALLATMEEGAAAPPPRLPAPLPPSLTPRRASLASGLLRAAAAAVVFGALGYALALMNRPVSPPAASAPPPVSRPATRESAAPAAPLATYPPEPRADRATPKTPRPEQFLPAPPRDPLPEEPPPPPDRSPFLARRDGRGIAEAIEVTPLTGKLLVVNEDTVAPLPAAAWVRPSQFLKSEAGGSFSIPGGTTVHLAREGEVAVAWSQSHLCYAVDLRQGEALVDLGAAPRLFFVASAPLGVGIRLQDSSGQLWLSADPQALRATPLDGAIAYRTPAGEGQTLPARQTLVLRPEGDAVEPPVDPSPGTAARFPSLGAEPRKPAPPAAAPPAPQAPRVAELCVSLGAQSYRYRVAGRQLREGSWFSPGILFSAIDEFSVVRRVNGTGLHSRRGTRAWDDLGPIRPGSREDRTLELLRRSLPPHAQLETALGWTRGDPQTRSENHRERPCTVSLYAYDPARLRGDVELLLGQAVLEGRLDRPDAVAWDQLEGSLEIIVTRDDPRILRAVDRRRVPYSYRTTTPGLSGRRTYHLESVYEFFDHDKAKLVLPAEILKDLVPNGK
jgi:ferric-dicitrate binding protein FerR (iron transport regulator)